MGFKKGRNKLNPDPPFCESPWDYNKSPSRSLDELSQLLPQGVCVLQLALPDNKHTPSEVFKRLQISGITTHVVCDLPRPVINPTLRNPSIATPFVTMPKAPAHIDDLAPTGHDDVRASGEVSAMESVAIAHTKEKTPHDHLRGSVFRPNPGHHLTALCDRKNVCHAPRLRAHIRTR